MAHFSHMSDPVVAISQDLTPPPKGSVLARLVEPGGGLKDAGGLLHWLRHSPYQWTTIKLDGQSAFESSYSRPESLRLSLPLTACPISGFPPFTSREMSLKCETFALMQPKPRLQRALLPILDRLEPYDVLVGVHLRTGYADSTSNFAVSVFQSLPQCRTPTLAICPNFDSKKVCGLAVPQSERLLQRWQRERRWGRERRARTR